MNNVEKRIEGRGDLKEKEKLIKLADREKIQSDVENEIIRLLDEKFEQQKKPGETFNEWLNRTDKDELLRLELSEGGVVDFGGMTVGDMKAIFKSENGFDASSPRELVRGVKMYLKNLDLDGIPFGAFDKKN